MANLFGDTALGTLPTFNDMPKYTCWIDGQTFDDAGVYAQHLLMYHGLVSSVTKPGTNQVIVPAPIEPIIPPPAPGFIPAPGVALVPVQGTTNYTPVYKPPLQPITPQPYTPSPILVTNPITTPSGSNSVSGWALAGIIGAMLAFSKTRKRK